MDFSQCSLDSVTYPREPIGCVSIVVVRFRRRRKFSRPKSLSSARLMVGASQSNFVNDDTEYNTSRSFMVVLDACVGAYDSANTLRNSSSKWGRKASTSFVRSLASTRESCDASCPGIKSRPRGMWSRSSQILLRFKSPKSNDTCAKLF